MRVTADPDSRQRYNAGLPGFYAVNPRTQIAVAGPFAEERPAQEHCNRVNRDMPPSPDPLEVRQVMEVPHES